MSKSTFTDEQVEELSKNPYIRNISNKVITYTDEFKVYFLAEREKGKLTHEFFENAGFPVDVLGKRKIYNSASRWLKAYQEKGITGVKYTRKGSSERPRLTELSTEEKLCRAQQEITLLKQENDLLKKLDLAERRKNDLSKTEKFELIKRVVKAPHSLSVRKACELLEVSPSGYYGYFSQENQRKRIWKEKIDLFLRDMVIDAMAYKKVEKGSRAIVMYFRKTKGIVVNRKKSNGLCGNIT